jgi:hypothetical protein
VFSLPGTVEILNPTHGLDACVVIAYLRGEPGTEVLKRILESSRSLLAMHVCDLGEVYYDSPRADGVEAAETATSPAGRHRSS